MRNQNRVSVIIPVLNEETSIGKVLSAIPPWVDEVVVVDNGSTDRTAEVARSHGARVVVEDRRGYGSACLAGLKSLSDPDVVVFLDGDFSDDPGEMALLVDPIASGEADLVIGSRGLGNREPGALTPQARFGNWLACKLIRWLWKVQYTDLGPFRAIRASALRRLGMHDPNYGWTVEMQIKATRFNLRVREVPVCYRRRIGKSKISGTVKGVLGAGSKILSTIFLAAIDSIRAREMREEQLTVFTRFPEPGKTKTRLIPVLGPEGAAKLQRRMTEDTLRQARGLARKRALVIEVRYEGGDSLQMRRWLGEDLLYRPQGDGDLGARLTRAFQKAFATGTKRVVIIGSDCPDLTADLLQTAFDSLAETEVVLGPAQDGGYYLVATNRFIPELFEGVPWGTERVLSQTRQILERLRIPAKLLAPLADVDRPEDLSHLKKELPACRQARPASPRISIIIVSLNEAPRIGAAWESARRGADVEVIVVDGGSQDGTVELARSLGAKVLLSPPGRARQSNAGAAAACGEVLLFLHADSRLPEQFEKHILQAISNPDFAAGAFELKIDEARPSLRLIEHLANFRSCRLHTPYGDQGIFLRASLFRELGGFPDQPIMEDFELIRRLRSRGRILIVPAPVTTSARRWKKNGVLKTTLINQVMILGYWWGIPPQRLAQWYNRNQGAA